MRVGELVDEGRGHYDAGVIDLHITGDTLIVPRLHERKLFSYQLH